MNFLPIAIRELQVASRRRSTYLWRTLMALNAAWITLAFLLAGFQGRMGAGNAGEMTFEVLAGAGFAIACLAAVMIADSVSEERRNGTLGFLFLTDLKGHDIILGKLARLSVPFYCLLAILPPLGITFILGGVSIGEFVMTALALVNALFFFSALGLLISARSYDAGPALSLAWAGVAICIAPALAALMGLNLSGPKMALLVPTPAGNFLAAVTSTSTTTTKPGFFLSLAVSHALGWLFIFAAARVVSRNVAAPEPQWSGRRYRMFGLEFAVEPKATGMKPTWGFVILLAGLAVLIPLVAAIINPFAWFRIPTFVAITFALHLLVKIRAAQNACLSLQARRQSGELELLLTTPLDGDAILRGSTTALKCQLLQPFLFVAAVDALLVVCGWSGLHFWDGFGYALAVAGEFVWFVLNLYSLTWVGLWLGMTSSSPARALGRTLFYILVLPWALALMAAGLAAVATADASSPCTQTIGLGALVVALIVCNLGFAGWAVSELRDRFRLLANQSAPPDPFLPSWRTVFAVFRYTPRKTAG